MAGAGTGFLVSPDFTEAGGGAPGKVGSGKESRGDL